MRRTVLSVHHSISSEMGSVGAGTQYKQSPYCLKGLYHKKFFYRPIGFANLIFWIVMGCGKARFGQKGQKTPKIENLGLKICSLGPQGDPHMRPRGNPR